RERNEEPDIDVDFEHQRREEVLQYIYEKYGREHAGMTATVTTYRSRSAIREVGKALGIAADKIDGLAKMSNAFSREGKIAERAELVDLDADSPTGQRFIYLVEQLMGFPRHLSQHVGGMVISRTALCELCPIENAAMPGRTVIQWDKDDLEELGILKIDVLALGMLSALRRSFDLISRHHLRDLHLANIPPDDTPTYDMICAAETVGVFQIESRAQMSMLPRLRPRCYYDLVIEVSIVRPGPIQGNMVHPYLRARENPNAVVYPNDAIRQVLQKTLGVPIFQEQAMRLAVVAAGFTAGEADQLRRAMAAWRRPGVIEKFRNKLMDGMAQNGLTGEFAEQVFHQIRGFGEYGFPESHAASFALLVYASCYIKCHYPAAFCAALLNSQPLGFYTPNQLISDARKNGVIVLPPEVNRSDYESILVDDVNSAGTAAIRLGLQHVRSLPTAIAMGIVEQRRQHGAYASVADLTRRARLSQSSLSILADADALSGLADDRRRAYWDALAEDERPRSSSGDLMALMDDVEEEEPLALESMSELEEVYADYNTTGISLRAHPISFCRDELRQLKCKTAAELKDTRSGRMIRVAGLVTMRQRPGTAKGITFVSLEDETGTMNLILYPAVWDNYFKIARTSNAWLAEGRLENKHNVIHVIIERLEDLRDRVEGLEIRTRDFR
ncbi:MAG: error-prone DNA polymerase, partial [Planctomycetota bacterium]